MMTTIKSFKDWIEFRKAVLLISGLVLSHELVEYTILAVLVILLENHWKMVLPKAAQVVNIYQGFSAVLVILATYVADAYLGRSGMTLLSASAFLIGLVVLYVAARVFQSVEIKILYGSLAFLIVGKAGRDVTLKAFFADQFRSTEPTSNEDDKQVESRRKVWWCYLGFLGFILAIVILRLRASWTDLCFITTIAMGFGFLCFLLGISFYNYKRPTGSSLTAVLHVLKAAILRNWRLCTPAEVKEVNLILTMIPMWTAFLVHSLVAATGSTFFFEQSSYMNSEEGMSVYILLMIKGSARFLTSYICGLLLPKLQIIRTPRLRFLLQIGLGMICSMFCCIIAWRVENYRLKNIDLISVSWLTPQFALLGSMEGFAVEGLGEFFTTQVSESMRIYGPTFNKTALGIGKFISVFFILIFNGWFGDDVNSSHLDRYYAMLGILSFLNLFLFGYKAYRYAHQQVETLARIDHHDVGQFKLLPTMRGQWKSFDICPQERSNQFSQRSLYRTVTVIGCESHMELSTIRAPIGKAEEFKIFRC